MQTIPAYPMCLLITLVLCTGCSTESDYLPVSPDPQMTTHIFGTPEDPLPTTALTGPADSHDGDCPYPQCEESVTAAKQNLQALANELCDTVWVDITCCLNGYETFVLAYVAPNHPHCFRAPGISSVD